jgi:hypothetical protein
VDTLPAFPDFVKLDIDHKDLLREIAEQFPPYSDFNFVSLFTWDTEGSIALATLHNNIVIRFSDYSDGSEFLSLLGINELVKTIDEVFKHCEQNGLTPELKLIGEAVIEALPESAAYKYIVNEDRDNHDYILSAINMSDLTKLHPAKRTKYNRFVREYGEKSECIQLDLQTFEVRNEIKQLLKEWQIERGRNDSEVKKEFIAINRCLEHATELNMMGYGTYISNKLVGFTLFELVNNKTAMLHFGKTNTAHKGANEHLQHNLAKYLKTLDVELMNNEQDLGIEGLRKSKEASLPVDFLKKYTITPAKP